LAFFLKTVAKISFCQNLVCNIGSQNRQFFLQNYLKNHNIDPRIAVFGKENEKVKIYFFFCSSGLPAIDLVRLDNPTLVDEPEKNGIG
jgi:hypothetical protein